MEDGSVHQGYARNARDGDILRLNVVGGQVAMELHKEDIRSMDTLGSLMPETAQSLSREELVDLLAYLSSLGKK